MGLVDVSNDASFKRYVNQESLLRGLDGKCFINGDKVIKIYLSNTGKFLNNYVDLSCYSSPYIAFPINYSVNNNKIVGEEMPYFRKNKLINAIDEETDVNLLKKNYLIIMKELLKFKDIYMKDLPSNILYNEDGFAIIDTFDWEMRKYKNQFANEELFNEDLMSNICDVIEINYGAVEPSLRESLFRRGKDGNELYGLLQWPNRESKYIFEILELFDYMYNKDYGEHLKTLEDVANYTKILKKG